MLTEIPASMCSLKKLWKVLSFLFFLFFFLLESIEAHRNMLTEIPATMCSLKKLSARFLLVLLLLLLLLLRKVMLADNKIRTLPRDLFALPLRTLDISTNQFEEFPPGLDR